MTATHFSTGAPLLHVVSFCLKSVKMLIVLFCRRLMRPSVCACVSAGAFACVCLAATVCVLSVCALQRLQLDSLSGHHPLPLCLRLVRVTNKFLSSICVECLEKGHGTVAQPSAQGPKRSHPKNRTHAELEPA